MPYKRVEPAVGACARLGRKVTVAGDGRPLGHVRRHGRHVPRRSRQTVEALADAIERFKGMTLDEFELCANAERFSTVRFHREVMRIIGEVAAAERVPIRPARPIARTAHSA